MGLCEHKNTRDVKAWVFVVNKTLMTLVKPVFFPRQGFNKINDLASKPEPLNRYNSQQLSD